MARSEKRRREGDNPGLVSCIGEHIEYAGRMIWPCPISEREYNEMRRAGFWTTVFFAVAFLALALLS